MNANNFVVQLTMPIFRSAPELQAALDQLDRARPAAPAAGQRPALRSTGGSWVAAQFGGVLSTLALAFSTLTLDAAPAMGPLRVHPQNSRYFANGTKLPDGSLRAVYLTGSHHWNNLQDSGRIGGPLTNRFDYDDYLRRLLELNHNFIRLWAWEGPAYWYQGGQNDQYYEPLPWARDGKEAALDGKPRFNLEQFNEEYFKRLRARVIAARDKGIYVSVMLFQGWSIYSHGYGNPWPGHPFNKANNVNNINGDPEGDGEGKEVHTLKVPEVTRRQEAYVRKVIDTVNDLDNVLYEITNETALWSKDWQYHIIRYVKTYESGKARQHPVGITAFDSGRAGSMEALFASPADWISPQNDGTSGDYQNDPPAADGRKIIISDTDHLWGVGGGVDWVWKSFARGHHTIYMDPFRKQKWFSIDEAGMEAARKAMGRTRVLAEKMNLHAMSPNNALCSTKYCLANPGHDYLVYQPRAGAFELTLEPGTFSLEWVNPTADSSAKVETRSTATSTLRITAPWTGPAVLWVRRTEATPP